MRLWVTRPVCDCEALQAKLLAQGHEVVAEPLLSIDFKDIGVLDLQDVQALIATSRNGVRAAASAQQAAALMQLPLFTVGQETAATAKAAGFQKVIAGPGTAIELLPIIEQKVFADGGRLLHLAGEKLAFDLPGALRQIGYRVDRQTVYVACAARHLRPSLLSQIAIGTIDGVILLSPRTAQTYIELISAYQLKQSAQCFIHFCLSEAIADKVSELQPYRVMVAERPNIGEILMLTGQTTAQF